MMSGKMTKDDRLKLNSLSKEAYGSSSRWQKKINKGDLDILTEIKEDGTERKFKGYTRFTVEEITTVMEEIIKKKAEANAKKEELVTKNE